MRPSVFVDLNFLKAHDEFVDSSGPYDVKHRVGNRNQLLEILKESDICVDMPGKDVIKLSKKGSSATFDPNSLQDVILLRALRGNRLDILPADYSIPQRVYLLDNDEDEIKQIAENHNILCEGIDYTYDNPISPRSFGSLNIDKEMKGIDKIRHRCRNVVLIDPYIFAPIGSKDKNVPKIPNLIKLLKELFLDNTNVECYLSVLYHRDSVGHSAVQGKIDEINNGLDNPNLKISAFGHGDNLFQSNRHLVTDYSIMDLQHPFDRDDSSISSNFLYDRDIKESFKRVKKLLDIGKTSFSSTRDSLGLQKVKFGNLLQNKLFK